jgi:hypothetical protein
VLHSSSFGYLDCFDIPTYQFLLKFQQVFRRGIVITTLVNDQQVSRSDLKNQQGLAIPVTLQIDRYVVWQLGEHRLQPLAVM